ncbi:hypothetical protein Lesp02_62010 [Lentzea sp. NBRC 105346]|uniref:DUF885 domain-containing protein n=1 Tax=Lentzea sp. NBRC 105346 TaxID=3032205 RepID=UPI0033266DD1|nr:hypothetical protein Lesp02_62010 [Lentzea sp. NBRC 105346]
MTSLADELFILLLDNDPFVGALLGLPGYDDRVQDVSVAAQSANRRRATEILGRADEETDPVTRAVIVQQANAMITTIDARLVEHTVADALSAPVAMLFSLLPMVDNTKRLPLVPAFVRQAAGRLRDTDRHPLTRHVHNAVAQLDAYLAGPVAQWEASNPDVVRTAMAEFRDVLRTEIAPVGRDDDKAGICWLPEGEANYARLVERYTTTKRTPEELHRLGLDLIAKLREEYVEIGSRVFGLRTVDEVFDRLRTDPALRWRDEQEMMDKARGVIVRAEKVAPQWFGKLPSSSCHVAFVPEADRGSAPIAYYVDPSLDGTRPGTYFVNPKNATERDRTVAEAVAFHEAVPGHHFQLALAQQLDLPDLRKYAFIEAYLEGWGLYAERLADEMGLYSDDVARLGMLTQDAMRAGRLVVDTGMHAFGWSRRRAIDYLRTNTVMAPVEIEAEIDRYIEVPGQALAYMVGRMEIQRLRAQAEAAMGDRFDIKEFHDLVLGGGPLPLDALADVVTGWSSPAPSSSAST